MSDYHINVFYSEEDAAYVADIPGSGGVLGVRCHCGGGSSRG